MLESFTLDHNLSFLQKGQQPDLSLMWTVGANFVVMGAESLLLTVTQNKENCLKPLQISGTADQENFISVDTPL